MKNKYYITTAIAYPNSVPHLGHALEIIQADCLARYNRLLGKKVIFQTGTDEHGIKNWTSAKNENKEILDFLDSNVNKFKELYDKLNISYDDFIRTSDKKKHYPGAIKLWDQLLKSDDIYKKKYSGKYCVGCESFKLERELIDGKCKDHPTRSIQEIEEENYFFKLSKYKEVISQKIEEDEYKIVPKSRKNEILSFLKDAKDISFSRPKSSLPWGITVPNDEEHVMYVWCDALSNYITGQGYGIDKNYFDSVWPADIHVIGKDILRFHAAFWPAMLLSAKLELPKELFVHGFLKLEGQKMGKSTGNVIDPFNQIEKFDVDGFRFYILNSMTLDGDGNYLEELVYERYNNELISNVSNFCYRSLSFTNKNFNSLITQFNESDELTKQTKNNIQIKIEKVKENFEKRDLKEALNNVLEISAIGNRYMQEKAPWKNKETSQEVLTFCINIVKNISILINPFIPHFSEELQKQLNLSNLTFDDINFDLKNHKVNDAEIILKKKIKEKEHPFSKVTLKVAKILSIEDHPKADRLYVLKIDLNNEKRQLVAGLKEHYKKEDLINKKIIIVSNLKPAEIMGVKSQGMLLAASKKDKVILINPVKSNVGDLVKVNNLKYTPTDIITIKEFFKVPLIVKDQKIFCEDNFLKTDSEEIIIDIEDGASVG